jgi:hypothetical protein
MRTFRDDDAGYLAWVEAHPNGFVVNAYREPTPAYLKLHRATCGTISRRPARGYYWTGDYAKFCAEDRAELDEWAWQAVGGELSPCGLCRPEPGRGICPSRPGQTHVATQEME